jgi:hypothetical protein
MGLEETENVVAGKPNSGVLQQGATDDHGPGREIIGYHQTEAKGFGGEGNSASAEEGVCKGEGCP